MGIVESNCGSEANFIIPRVRQRLFFIVPVHLTIIQTQTNNKEGDSKKRVTLRGAKYQYYNVREYENGCIMLEPR